MSAASASPPLSSHLLSRVRESPRDGLRALIELVSRGVGGGPPSTLRGIRGGDLYRNPNKRLRTVGAFRSPGSVAEDSMGQPGQGELIQRFLYRD